MTWKTRNRSFYYEGAPEPDDLDLKPAETALLVIDVQNTYVERPDRATLSPGRSGELRTSGRRFMSGCGPRSSPTPGA